jgi:hypothetical protein
VLASGYALHVAVEEHAQALARLGKVTLREAVDFFLSHHRADVPRLMLAETAEQFAASRQQSGLSAHYISQCRKTVSDLSKAFPSKALTDLRTSELDAWLGALPLWAYVATVPASLCKSDEDPPFRPTLLGTAFWLGDAFLPTGQRPGKFLAATHAKPCKTGYTTATDNSLSIFRETP